MVHFDLPLLISPYFGEFVSALIFGFLTVALVVLLVVLYGVLLEAGQFFWSVMRTFLLVALQPVEQVLQWRQDVHVHLLCSAIVDIDSL